MRLVASRSALVPRRVGAVVAGVAVAAAAACASAPPPISHVEDKARLDVPIAICRKALPPGAAGDAGTLPPDAYWSVVFPAFTGFGSAVVEGAADCIGEMHAPPKAPAAGVAVSRDDAVIVPADDGVQSVWLPAFREADGVGVGPLALVQPRASEIDVYAIGSYQGSTKHSRFNLARLGSARMVAAFDDRCAEVKVDTECESQLTFYATSGGALSAVASTPLSRVRYGTLKGLGRVQYRLATDAPVFDKSAVRVHERLQVRDSGDEDVRKAEGDRVFVLGADGRMTAQQDSLWAQVPEGGR